MFSGFYNSKLWLAPPQFYELSRLIQYDKFDDIENFSRTRRECSVDRWLPVRINTEDGVLSVLPGMYEHELALEFEIFHNLLFYLLWN